MAAAAAVATQQLMLLLMMMMQLTYARSIGEARTECMAICFAEFKESVSNALSQKLQQDPGRINVECLRPSRDADDAKRHICTACTHTCNHFATEKYIGMNCRSFCKKKFNESRTLRSTCKKSCKTLKDLFDTNQGSCRAPTRGIAGGSKLCHQESVCKSDTDCVRRRDKCCRTECGMRCTAAMYDKLLPSIPNRPQVQDINTTLIRLRWSHQTSHPNPIVYLLQLKILNAATRGNRNREMNAWRDLSFSTRKQVDVELSLKYRLKLVQFRLSAISVNGFDNYSAVSQLLPIKLPEVPFLESGTQRLDRGWIRVKIRWQKPKSTFWNLKFYQIKWTELLEQGVYASSERMTNVTADRQWYLLQSLKPNTDYTVNIRAVYSMAGGESVSSSWKSITIRTTTQPPIPAIEPGDAANDWRIRENEAQNEQQQQQRQRGEVQANWRQPKMDCSCMKQPSTPLKIRTPFFENGDLKMILHWPSQSSEHYNLRDYKLEWEVKVCIESNVENSGSHNAFITDSHEYNITRLMYNCHYTLRLSGLDASGTEVFAWNTCFCTASCKETPIRGSRQANCPRDESSIMPQPPDKIFHQVQQPPYRLRNRQLRVAALIKWAAPLPLKSISGFRITWGPRMFEDVSPLAYSRGLLPKIDRESSDTKVLPSGVRQFMMRDLYPGTVYIVSLQTITIFGDSAPRVLFFETPGMRLKSEVQKYIHVGASAAMLRAEAAVCIALLFAHWLAAL